MVLHEVIALDRLILVLCMSFAVGPSVLKALNFAGKFPQLNYKIDALEKMMSLVHRDKPTVWRFN